MAAALQQPSRGVGSRAQAAAAAVALVALTLVLFGGLTQREVGRALEDQTREELEAVGASIAEELRTPIAFASAEHLERLASDAFTHVAIASVRIADEDGRALALQLRQDPSRLHDARAIAISAAPASLRTAEPVHAGKRHLGWACRTPVWSTDSPTRLLGYVTVTASAERDGRLAAALPRAAAAAGALSLLFAGLVAIWGAARLMKPIRRVAAAAADLRAGRTPDDIPREGPRETRELADAFNAMHRSLTDARVRLEKSNADLERQVLERTGQLSTMNTLLEQQMRDKNDFIRSVSHDLGAPLRNIAGMATMVLEEHAGALPDDAVHWLERIGANVRIESDMLSELVELSRAAERTERLDNIHVRTIADELAASLAPDLARENITLEIARDLPTLRVDRTDLWMLLQNLTDNAIKYMGASETRRVTIAPLVRAGATIGLIVSDTGPGIPLNEQPHLFRAFQRASTGEGREGSGVGLSVVQNTAQRWGGDARVVSSPGQGARFEITLDPERVVASTTAPNGSRTATSR